MKTIKKTTALVIALMLTLTMCFTSVSFAATTDTTTNKVIYLKPSTNWCNAGARFAAYVWIGTGSKSAWVSMTDNDKDGYYEANLPEGNWQNVIFCRMNPATTVNNWNTKWNQTSDLVIPTDYNCYSNTPNTWDKGGGTWLRYTPVVPTTAEPTTEPVTEPETTVEPTEPVTEPETTVEPTEPVTEPETTVEPTEPVTEPETTVEPTTEPVTEPETTEEPTTEPVTEPETTEEPTTEPVTEPETTVEPTTEPVTEPETTVEPTTEPTKESLNVKATSNLFTTAEQSYDESAKTVTVKFMLKSNQMVQNGQWTLYYDSTKLAYSDSNTIETVMPVTYTSAVINPNLLNKVKGNFSSLALYDFSDSTEFVTVTFDVIGTGDTTINLDVEYLSVAYYDDADEEYEAYLVTKSVVNDVTTDPDFADYSYNAVAVLNTPVEPILYGDVDGDGKVTVADATLLQKYLILVVQLDDDALIRADINHDCYVNILDVCQIQKYVINQ